MNSDLYNWRIHDTENHDYYLCITDILSSRISEVEYGRIVDDVWCDAYLNGPVCYTVIGDRVRPISTIENLKRLTKFYYFANKAAVKMTSFYLYCSYIHQTCSSLDDFKFDCDVIIEDGEQRHTFDGSLYVTPDQQLMSEDLFKLLKKCNGKDQFASLVTEHVKQTAIFSGYDVEDTFSNHQWISSVMRCSRCSCHEFTVQSVLGSIL